jgi:hypothetical protein
MKTEPATAADSMRDDHPPPARSPSIRRASLAAALWLACAAPLHAQPTRRPAVDLESIVARVTGSSSPASWKVPSDAYLRERKAMLEELRINRERWARRRPATYAFRFGPPCVRTPDCGHPGLKVAVPGDPPRAGTRDAPGSMEDVFALLEHTLRSDVYRVSRVRYHPRLGYPLRWKDDVALPIAGGRNVRWVRGFRAIPPPGGTPARRTNDDDTGFHVPVRICWDRIRSKKSGGRLFRLHSASMSVIPSGAALR